MIILIYSIEINAEKEHIWNTMLDPETYQKWSKAFSSDSKFIGEWKRGETIIFFDSNVGGTKAVLEIFNPYDEIFTKHISMVDKDMNENNEDEMSKKWIGSTEKYSFIETGDNIKLEIEMTVDETFTEMFNTSWPKALEIIKSLCELK
jgi:hypothetical protein